MTSEDIGLIENSFIGFWIVTRRVSLTFTNTPQDNPVVTLGHNRIIKLLLC